MLDDRTKLLFAASGVANLPLLFAPRVVRCMAAGPGGRPLTVLLDTGTDPSAIDLGLARRLGLRIGEFALGSDATRDDVPFTETVLPWLRLGDLTLRDLYALAIDLRDAPFKVDLVLGYNVLSRLALVIDYARGLLQLRHPDLAPLTPASGGAVLPLQFFEHFPAFANLSLALDGSTQPIELPPATIDTGSNGALTLSPDLATAANAHASDLWLPGGAGQSFAGVCAVRQSVASLALGPFMLSDVELDAPSEPRGDFGRPHRANLGNGVLGRFSRVTVDYRRAHCVLEP